PRSGVEQSERFELAEHRPKLKTAERRILGLYQGAPGLARQASTIELTHPLAPARPHPLAPALTLAPAHPHTLARPHPLAPALTLAPAPAHTLAPALAPALASSPRDAQPHHIINPRIPRRLEIQLAVRKRRRAIGIVPTPRRTLRVV